MSYKKYVDVIVCYYPDSKIVPLSIYWEGGSMYEIDRVLDIRPVPSLKAGRAEIRYTCMIQGHEKYLWLEESKWFVEAKI